MATSRHGLNPAAHRCGQGSLTRGVPETGLGDEECRPTHALPPAALSAGCLRSDGFCVHPVPGQKPDAGNGGCRVDEDVTRQKQGRQHEPCSNFPEGEWRAVKP